MNELKISEVIKKLEEFKKSEGDIKIMIRSTYGEKDYIDDIFIGANNNEKVIEMWS